MSDHDEHGNRIPDNDELQEAWEQKRARRLAQQGCQCGPDMAPGCPGPMHCPANNYGRED